MIGRLALAEDQESLFVQAEFLALTRAQALPSLLAVMGAALLEAAMVVADVAWPWLAAWLGLVLAGQLWRQHVLHRPLNPTDAQQVLAHMRQYVWLAPLNSALFALYFLNFPLLTDAQRSVVTLIFLGQLMGSISNVAGQRSLFVLYCAPLLVALSLAWMLAPGGHSVMTGFGVGALILCGLGPLLYGLARRVWQLFESSCRIRFREHALNERLRGALREAEQANQAKSRFLAAASHDLRQPLHVMSMVTGALGLRPLDATSQNMVQLLAQTNAALSSLLDSLLDISKLDAGLVTVHAQPVQVARLMQGVYASLQALAQAKGLQAELSLAVADDETLETDLVLLMRVMNNLTQNAVKFTRQGGVRLSARVEGESLVLEVADSGCGIAAEHQEAVFHEFFQVSNPARDASAGLGLGLSIVKRLAALLGARLHMVSAPGQGTCVQLYLPRQQTAPRSHPAPLPPSGRLPRPPDRGRRVLVVDDDAAVRQASHLLLTELGCDCRTAAALGEARQQLTDWVPDLLICDLRLPGALNGIDTIAALRETLGQPVPALLMSGDTAPERLQLAQAAGLPLCHKPISLERLAAALQAID